MDKNPEKWQAFLDSNPLRGSHVRDTRLAKELSIRSFPSNLIATRDGVVLVTDVNDYELGSFVVSLLAEKEQD